MRRADGISYVFVAVVFAAVYLPIALVVLTSFNSATITTLPVQSYSLKWYAALFSNTRTLASLWVSIKLGVAASAAATLLGLCAALAVTRYDFRGRHAFLALMTLPMVAPGIVMGVSLLIFARYMGLKTGFAALFLGHTLLALPYCTFIIMASLARFDRNLEDAARGLGAGEIAVLRRIVLPGIASGHPGRPAVRLYDLDRRIRGKLLPHLGRRHDAADPDLLHRESGNHAGDQRRFDSHPGGDRRPDARRLEADLETRTIQKGGLYEQTRILGLRIGGAGIRRRRPRQLRPGTDRRRDQHPELGQLHRLRASRFREEVRRQGQHRLLRRRAGSDEQDPRRRASEPTTSCSSAPGSRISPSSRTCSRRSTRPRCRHSPTRSRRSRRSRTTARSTAVRIPSA